MAKKELDMQNGSLWNKILIYALPLAATGILQQMFNAADLAVVGNFSGMESMAAVGSNTPVIGILVNLFVGISLGVNVVLANAIGKKDEDSVKEGIHTAILIAISGGILLAAIGEAIAEPIINLLQVPDNVHNLALLYLRIYILGLPFIFLYNFEAAIYRSVGNTRTPLLALTVSGIINVILNLLFVCVLGMAVAGVALATVLSNIISSAILFRGLCTSDTILRIERSRFRMNKDLLKKILRIGLPSGVQSMVFSLANLVIQASINTLGSVVMAASSAAFNIEILVYFVMNSFGQACTTFVGQNYGAQKIDRCKRTLKICLGLDFVMMIFICGIVLLFSHFLLGLFNSDPQVVEIGYTRLLWIFLAYLFSVAQEVLSGYLRGFGMALIPAVVCLVVICGTRITWIFTVFQQNPTFQTIMQAYPISLALTALLLILVTAIYKPAHRLAPENS